jgi:hypothetical protein
MTGCATEDILLRVFHGHSTRAHASTASVDLGYPHFYVAFVDATVPVMMVAMMSVTVGRH